MNSKVFKTKRFPFLELRYISKVISCDKKHQHKELTLTAIKSGKINILFNDKIDSLEADQLSIVNPQEVHCATLSDIQSLGCYVLYLDKLWCEDIQASLFEDKSEFIPIKTSLIQDMKFYKDFIKVCDLLFFDDISFIEKEEKLIDFISELFLSFCDKNQIKDKDSKNHQGALKIKKYLEDNIEEDILLEDISNSMNLSIVHILRVFKKEFGLPIHSYILNKKVHLAKDLLSKGMPISEVAQMSGFFDQSHLNRSFKRVFQLTPKEYQKNMFS